MSEERRRYFRITETVGLSYTILDEFGPTDAAGDVPASDILAHLTEQDKKIEMALLEVEKESPKVAELVSLFNQKLERIVNLLTMEGRLLDQIAMRIREVNISACGIAFTNEEHISEGRPLRLELTLYPEEKKIVSDGRVVSCDPAPDGRHFYMRVDFYAMSKTAQEELIQHIVKTQSSQLQQRQKNK